MKFEDLPIRRKIMAAILLTSITVVILTVAVFMTYDLTTIRKSAVRDFSTLARIISWNSSGALAFNNDSDAREVLSSLAVEPQILSAALYDSRNQIFATYRARGYTNTFPLQPDGPSPRIERSHIVFLEPVNQHNIRFGTLYLETDLQFFYARLRLYAILAGLIILGSIAISLALSTRLQRNISDPILALTGTARRISEWGDYSVRASRGGKDELGLLTDAFNQMLARIQEQTVAIQESENRLRLSLEASNTGTWQWNVATDKVTWDDRNAALFGLRPGEFNGTYEHFLELIQPGNHASVARALKDALDNKADFSVEFETRWPDGSVHSMLARGRAFYDETGKAVRMSGITQDITEREHAEEASRRLAAIVESTDDAIIGKTLDGIVTSWNKAAERMFGYTAGEMIGQSIERIAVPEEAGFEQRVLDSVRRGETRTYETRRVRKDGSRLDVSLSVSAIHGTDGRIIGASSISRDITERKRWERDLEESRARLSGVITSAMDAIISVDAEQKVTLFNAAAERMFCCSAAEAMGKPLDLFIPEGYRREHRKHVTEFGETGTTARAMGHLRPLAGLRLNGEEFPIEASISHIEVGGQQIFTVILRDITERMQAQESLERQARVLREQAQMLDLANVLVRDMNDRVILWNTGMEKMYGWLRTEVLGRISHEVLKTKLPVPAERIKTTLLQEGQWEGELIHTRKDGRTLTVKSLWVLHKDPQGHPTAILEVNTDITERKEAENQILRMNSELEQRVKERTTELMAANQELEAFTYSVAHDLRAPLRHIDAFSRIVVEEFGPQLPADAQRFLQNIRKGSQNMNQLVDDLLNLARVGRKELKREVTPLNLVAEEVISELKRDTDHRDIEWRVSPLPTVEADPGLIKQVFVNLLSNAVKYTRPRARTVIEIGQMQNNGEPAIFVRDNGVGFNMKYSDKLFGVFQRLHRADEFEGTGVGLATVHRIIRKHGGHIWAEAELDKGATFYFTLSPNSKPPEVLSKL